MNAPALLAISLFETGGFVSRSHCMGDRWDLIGPYIAANIFVALAYFSIPLVLLKIARRHHIALRGNTVLVVMFAIFIVACGAGHALDIAMVWWPAFRLKLLCDGITAAASIGTACYLTSLFRHNDDRYIH